MQGLLCAALWAIAMAAQASTAIKTTAPALTQLREQAAALNIPTPQPEPGPAPQPVIASPSKNAAAEAASTITSLVRKDGFIAGLDYREFWTRDMGYSLPILVAAGYADLVETHLKTMLTLQNSNGNLPAKKETPEGQFYGFLNTVPDWFKALRYRGFRSGHAPGDTNANFRPNEADNPVIFLTSVKTYERLTGRRVFSQNYPEALSRLQNYIETMPHNGPLLEGTGWTDAMENYSGKYMLHVQVWLYKMYQELGDDKQMASVRAGLDGFWREDLGYYTDYLGGDRFDTLGNAMLLEEGLVPPSRVPMVLKALLKACTRYGYVNLYPAYTIGESSLYPHEYQNMAIWPFIEYHVAHALIQYGRSADAQQLMTVMDSRQGMYEWYSPVDGKPDGSPGQLWTAAAVLGIHQLLGR